MLIIRIKAEIEAWILLLKSANQSLRRVIKEVLMINLNLDSEKALQHLSLSSLNLLQAAKVLD